MKLGIMGILRILIMKILNKSKIKLLLRKIIKKISVL